MNNNFLLPSSFVSPGVLLMKAEESERRSTRQKSENDNQIAAAKRLIGLISSFIHREFPIHYLYISVCPL